jgi:DNA-binding transcriptional ArsR family regulator
MWLTIRQRAAIINHMVERSAVALDRVFRALASAPRREILRRAAKRRCTVTELAEHFDMSLAAVSKHVGVLDEAQLLVQTREGRLLWRRFNPQALEPARATLEELRGFWSDQLDGLERFLVDQNASLRARKGKRKARR